jgi:alkylhydroperoxidase family enzyme
MVKNLSPDRGDAAAVDARRAGISGGRAAASMRAQPDASVSPDEPRGKQRASAVDRIVLMRQHARTLVQHAEQKVSVRLVFEAQDEAESASMSKPRISYVDPAKVKDAAMREEFDRCAREGTPRPESQAIRAHVPAVFWSFANSWRDVFKNGVADHGIKELCRIYVSRSVLCEFCGNQRSIKAAKQGIVEDDYRDLINFESSSRYDERQKAALSYAEAITWDLPVDDKFWARLHKHFSEPELVEIGYFIALTMGQQRWLRTLGIEHHQILAGTDASMAPGFETADALERSKQAFDYWAKTNVKSHAAE